MIDRKEKFERLMKPCIEIGVIPKNIIDILDKQGFFNAPASRGHHGNYEGGLYDHSEAVTMKLLELTQKMDLKWERPESPYIVGMFHDLCKTDDYKFVPSGEKISPFTIENNEDKLLNGHGEKSVILLLQLMKLTQEEIACIRYHMGAFKKDDIQLYCNAVHDYPNVLWTHSADMYASQVSGI